MSITFIHLDSILDPVGPPGLRPASKGDWRGDFQGGVKMDWHGKVVPTSLSPRKKMDERTTSDEFRGVKHSDFGIATRAADIRVTYSE
jgi:hypothetical protein